MCLLCRQGPTCYDEMLKKGTVNLHVCDGHCCKLPYHLQSSDRGNAGCVRIDLARESVDASEPRYRVLLQVRSTFIRIMHSFIHSFIPFDTEDDLVLHLFNFQNPLACL